MMIAREIPQVLMEFRTLIKNLYALTPEERIAKIGLIRNYFLKNRGGYKDIYIVERGGRIDIYSGERLLFSVGYFHEFSTPYLHLFIENENPEEKDGMVLLLVSATLRNLQRRNEVDKRMIKEVIKKYSKILNLDSFKTEMAYDIVNFFLCSKESYSLVSKDFINKFESTFEKILNNARRMVKSEAYVKCSLRFVLEEYINERLRKLGYEEIRIPKGATNKVGETINYKKLSKALKGLPTKTLLAIKKILNQGILPSSLKSIYSKTLKDFGLKTPRFRGRFKAKRFVKVILSEINKILRERLI
ncbi:MAG: hypothetical protein J7L39_03265 [Candidatus Aenigmarchaeota archaeon]|nr:hypothetical protein [Candidatus Aenigmarchaeota archaeon]